MLNGTFRVNGKVRPEMCDHADPIFLKDTYSVF